MKMGPDLGLVVVPPINQDLPGRRVLSHLMGYQESQGKTEFLGDEFQPAKLGHIRHPGWGAGILSGKQPLFFYVNADYQPQFRFPSHPLALP